METYDLKKTRERISEFEGLRLKPYLCPAGRTTIGFGRNLSDVGISEAEARIMLANDTSKCISQLVDEFPWFESLNVPRQAVMIDLCFNLGITKLLTFKKFLLAMEAKQYRKARDELLDSAYAKQVGRRAAENAEMVLEGEW